jgi:hypothetical protein
MKWNYIVFIFEKKNIAFPQKGKQTSTRAPRFIFDVHNQFLCIRPSFKAEKCLIILNHNKTRILKDNLGILIEFWMNWDRISQMSENKLKIKSYKHKKHILDFATTKKITNITSRRSIYIQQFTFCSFCFLI